jgi:redox-sensitive bicupin YhaK (pirin superfamily)
MTFDPENGVDPSRCGFLGLESLNEEQAGPEMGLPPNANKDIDLIPYVREGAIIHQDEAGIFGGIGAGESQRRGASSRLRFQAVLGSLIYYTAQVFQGGLGSDSLPPGIISEPKRFYSAERTGTLRLVASQGGKQDSLSLTQDVRGYSSIPLQGSHVVHEFKGGSTEWLHAVKGRRMLQEQSLQTGDGVALVDEAAASFTAPESSEILPFDLT